MSLSSRVLSFRPLLRARATLVVLALPAAARAHHARPRRVLRLSEKARPPFGLIAPMHFPRKTSAACRLCAPPPREDVVSDLKPRGAPPQPAHHPRLQYLLEKAQSDRVRLNFRRSSPTCHRLRWSARRPRSGRSSRARIIAAGARLKTTVRRPRSLRPPKSRVLIVTCDPDSPPRREGRDGPRRPCRLYEPRPGSPVTTAAQTRVRPSAHLEAITVPSPRPPLDLKPLEYGRGRIAGSLAVVRDDA